MIYASEQGAMIRSVDWGRNDSIVFIQGVNPHSVFTIRPDGTNLAATGIPINYFQADNIRWNPDGESLYLIYSNSHIYQFNITGQLISDSIGFTASDFDFLPDGRIGYIKPGQNGHIGIFDPETGTSVVLDDMPYLSNRFDIAYSQKHNALLWAVDTVLGITSIQTGQTTILKEGALGIAKYYTSAASTNGYLTYKAYFISPSLSTPSARMLRDELRFIKADGTDERRLVLDFE